LNTIELTFGSAYAIWFDYKRQSDPEFRRTLKRDNRRMARAVKEEVEAQGAAQRDAIKKAVSQAKDEGFPTDLEEKEGYFMSQVAKGESLCAEGTFISPGSRTEICQRC
jgi:import receptor subunit TOM20